MPLREHVCETATCLRSGAVVEEFFKRSDETEPNCPACGHKMLRLASRFGVIWTGNIADARYREKKPESLTGPMHYDPEGQWVWEKRSTPDGNPKPRLLRTYQDQKDFCKKEGLLNPSEIGNAEVSADGRELQTKGVKGQWV